jgi:hypothetical protein
MGYKNMRNSLGFADLALASSLKHNRSLKLMNKLNEAINWVRVEQILMAHYTVGTSGEGADAYPPLLLFKCMLLQKWFRINSDPELENQINDRLSFKKSEACPLATLPLTIQPSQASENDCPKMPWIKFTPLQICSKLII